MEEVKPVSAPAAPVVRLRAQASYAYYDFSDSLAVSKKMLEMQGGGCSPDQLAQWLDYKSTKSGTFVSRVSAARQFGLVATEDAGLVVTERARQILSPVMPEDAAAAMADAFLAVELFGKIYDKYRGTTIPPRVGMKNLFMTSAFGLSDEAADRAVRVLFESAKQTGMFSGQDETRLVRPGLARVQVAAVAETPAAPPPTPAAPATNATGGHEHNKHGGSSGGSGGGGSGVPPGVHGAIIGLLRDLPPPGADFPKKAKARFVKAFLATLDFAYPSSDDDIETQT